MTKIFYVIKSKNKIDVRMDISRLKIGDYEVIDTASNFYECLALAELISLETCTPLHSDIVVLLKSVSSGLIDP